MMLVGAVVVALLLLNHYPVSMRLQETVTRANASALADLVRQFAETGALIEQLQQRKNREETEQNKAERSGEAQRSEEDKNKQARDSAQPDAEMAELAHRWEASAYCSGLTVLDKKHHTVYTSAEKGVEEKILREFRQYPMNEERQLLPKGHREKEPLYAAAPVYGQDGQLLGQIIASLHYGEGQTDLQEAVQKTQRDLNAMTMLVMLIALLIVWDLTDKIKGTMFNLEPEEIAQLLVERNALIDAVRDGIVAVDEEGSILHCNRTATALCQQHLGQEEISFSTLIPELSLASLLSRKTPLFDYEGHIGKEKIYMNFIPIVVENSDKKSLLMTFRPKQEVVRFAEDITGVRSYIEALRGQMHEFHNKLQAISGLVHEQNFPALQEYLDGLLHLQEREKETLRGKIHDPILCAFLLSKFDRATEKKVDLVLTDHSLMEQTESNDLIQDLVVITGNLLDNAFDAAQSSAMRMVTLDIVETGKEITISVWNSGAPIEEEQMEQIFDYGVTTKKEGNGIGLHLVKKACARHNGYVSVSSDEQSGTEFVAHLIRKEEA